MLRRSDTTPSAESWRCDFAEIVIGADLEGEAAAGGAGAVLDQYRMMVERTGEISGLAVAFDQREAENVGVIGDLTLDIGRLECRVGEPARADHLGHPWFV